MAGAKGVSATSFDAGSSNSEPLDLPSVDAAKFEDALLSSGTSGHSRLPEQNNGFVVDQHRLTAADDAWVGFLAKSEQLQNPKLSAEKKTELLNELADTWRSFRSQSEPIVRQIEDYIAGQAPRN